MQKCRHRKSWNTTESLAEDDDDESTEVIATQVCQGRELELPLSIIDEAANDLSVLETESAEEFNEDFDNELQHIDRELCVGVITNHSTAELIINGVVLYTTAQSHFRCP